MAGINIAELARRAGNRRNRIVLRAISPTKTQADDLYRVFRPVTDTWDRECRLRLMPEYSRTLSQMQTDSIIDLEAIIRFIDDLVSGIIAAEISAGITRWSSRMSSWHLARFIANLKYATNVDLSTILGSSGSHETLRDFLARNTALIRDVSDQTRGRVSDIVFRNLQIRTPARDVAREISEATGLGRKRAMRIAADQTQKISASLDRQRMIDIGITKFEWLHSMKLHPRAEHVARNGEIFAWNSEVARTDPPGYAPFCGCKAKGVIE